MTKASLMVGKIVRYVTRLRGGGSALPGLIVEKLDKRFLHNTLSHLPYGVVIISGTNGKTTTTKMVVELLSSQGMRVFTNATGSNFKRGVISSVIEKASLSGHLPYDIAVLELDEAHAVHFVKEIPPRYCLLLNVMRDQLDRFGEIDTTAKMLEMIAHATTQSVVANREDERIVEFAQSLEKPVVYYGLSSELRKRFPTDDDLYRSSEAPSSPPPARVMLCSIDDHRACFTIDGMCVKCELKLSGLYNIFNAAGALTLVKTIMGKQCDDRALFHTLSNITPAFGRGEQIKIGEHTLELVLVKNPGGFRLGLQSFDSSNAETMIAINDNYADGRDMSWLWDVDFSSLSKKGVSVVSGVRAYDMALRLMYDEVEFRHVQPDLAHALKLFIKTSQGNMRIFCTYTAMLKLRQELKKYTKVERVL
jgi:UDP-N-acetylmuramyl tripeptide synthase